MTLTVALVVDTFNKRHGDTGAELDEPVVILAYGVVCLTGNVGNDSGFFLDYYGVLSLGLKCGHRECAACSSDK